MTYPTPYQPIMQQQEPMHFVQQPLQKPIVQQPVESMMQPMMQQMQQPMMQQQLLQKQQLMQQPKQSESAQSYIFIFVYCVLDMEINDKHNKKYR